MMIPLCLSGLCASPAVRTVPLLGLGGQLRFRSFSSLPFRLVCFIFFSFSILLLMCDDAVTMNMTDYVLCYGEHVMIRNGGSPRLFLVGFGPFSPWDRFF